MICDKKYNKYDLSGEFGVGWTSNTNNEFYFDLDDYDKIKNYCWYEHANKDGYRSLQTNIRIDDKTRSTIKMHWIVANKYYDHKNRNPLDNRKINLRPANNQDNARNHNKQKNNTSGFIGVNWHKQHQMWVARITIDKKKIHLGYFFNKDDAVKIRLQAEVKYFKEFAPQRHLFEKYGIETYQETS